MRVCYDVVEIKRDIGAVIIIGHHISGEVYDYFLYYYDDFVISQELNELITTQWLKEHIKKD